MYTLFIYLFQNTTDVPPLPPLHQSTTKPQGPPANLQQTSNKPATKPLQTSNKPPIIFSTWCFLSPNLQNTPPCTLKYEACLEKISYHFRFLQPFSQQPLKPPLGVGTTMATGPGITTTQATNTLLLVLPILIMEKLVSSTLRKEVLRPILEYPHLSLQISRWKILTMEKPKSPTSQKVRILDKRLTHMLNANPRLLKFSQHLY